MPYIDKQKDFYCNTGEVFTGTNKEFEAHTGVYEARNAWKVKFGVKDKDGNRWALGKLPLERPAPKSIKYVNKRGRLKHKSKIIPKWQLLETARREEMRTAQQKDIYNNLGEVITTTIAEFCIDNKLSETNRKKLYKKAGWIDSDEIHWRVGEAPDLQKQMMTLGQQTIYNFAEDDYIKYIAEGDTSETNHLLDQLKGLIKSYNKTLYIREDQYKTNLHKFLSNESNRIEVNEYWKPFIEIYAVKKKRFKETKRADQIKWTQDNLDIIQ